MMNTTKPKFTLFVLLSVVALLLLFFFLTSNQGRTLFSKNRYNVETVNLGKGWGYLIKQNEKIIIFQPHIPGMDGETQFPEEQQAKEVGKIVARKLSNGNSPTVSKEEIDNVLTN